MQSYKSQYGEKIAKVLNTYPMGSPGLVVALETLCMTAEQNGHAKGREQSAEDVCDGLHNGPSEGLMCRSCYNAEVGYVEQQKIESRRAVEDAQYAEAEAKRIQNMTGGLEPPKEI